MNHKKCPTTNKKISCVFIIYNEADTIESMLRNFKTALKGLEHEMIVVEDGSTDDTPIVLRRLKKDLQLKVISDLKRLGYREAIKRGVARCKYQATLLVDGDYQFSAADFLKILNVYSSKNPIVLGKKSPRKDPFYRILLSFGLNLLLRVLFGVPTTDADTGLRVIQTELLKKIAPKVKYFTYFNAEFVVRAYHAGYPIREIPVNHYARKSGASRIFYVSKLPVICILQFLNILKLKRELCHQSL